MHIFCSDLLHGRRAFITGGGSGICKGIAHAFLAHGAKVTICSRNQARLDAAAAELSESAGSPCFPIAADVRHPEQVEAAVERAFLAMDGLDLVVNGAAGNFLAPAAGLSPKGFRTVMEIDTLGTYNVSYAAFHRGLHTEGGHILNISATLQYTGMPFQVHAGSAKAAVDAMTRHLAMEWAPCGIRVNAIAPGPIADTEGMSRLAPGPLKTKMEQRVPLGRFGTVNEVAQSALFLSSAAASYITGAILVVDGGAWLNGNGLLGDLSGELGRAD